MTRIMTALLAVSLIAALWAAPAYASGLSAVGLQETAASATTPTAPTSATPAKTAKVNVYVLTKIGDMNCTYNSKGLIAKRSNASTTVKFKYSGTNIKSYTSVFSHGRSYSKTTGKLTYKSGRLTKLVEKGSNGAATDSYSYNKAGRISKYTHSASGKKKVKYKCAYDANGRLSSRNASGGDKSKEAYTYDATGNLSSTTHVYGSGGYTMEYANKYKSKRLAKRTATLTSLKSWTTVTTYGYKKMQVPAKYAQAVADQQWALLNPQVSFSYPLNY